MATIKVIYKSTVRRFTIAQDSTWTNLESQLRDLFGILNTTSIVVSYTDEDGDLITVSSDLEFQEFLSQYSTGKAIRLELTTVNYADNNNDTSSTLVVEQQQQHINAPKEPTQSEETKEESFVHVDMGKEPERQESADEPHDSSANDTNEHHIFVMGRSFYPGPLFGGLQFGLFDAPEFGRLGYRQCPFNFGPNNFAFGGPAYTSLGGRQCEQSGKNCSNQTSRKEFGQWRQGGCHMFRECQQLSSEQLAEGVNTLNSMGFTTDNSGYEDLLKRFNGNIDHVVEILLRRQDDNVNFEQHSSSSKNYNIRT